MVTETRVSLLELNERARKIKSNPNLRHMPNERDIAKSSENARIMQAYQYQTIKPERDDD